jgi:hypothetical protein
VFVLVLVVVVVDLPKLVFIAGGFGTLEVELDPPFVETELNDPVFVDLLFPVNEEPEFFEFPALIDTLAVDDALLDELPELVDAVPFKEELVDVLCVKEDPLLFVELFELEVVLANF